MKRFLITIFLLAKAIGLCLAQSQGQNVQPTIMVVPFTKEGEDIRTVLESDVNKRAALTSIREEFDNRGFTTIDFLGKFRAMSTSSAFNEGNQSDFVSEVIQNSGADVYITAEINLLRRGDGAKSVGIILNAYDVSTGQTLGNKQANSILHSTQANVPALETSIHSTINALALLTGRYGHELRELLEPGRPLPEYHRLVTAGVPAELLRRRPDIVAAEAQLAASAEAVGIAKKDYLPTLSLTGNVGVSSHGHGKFFSSDKFVYSIAPTLSWTLFDGMARNARVASAREEMEAQIEQYNLTVMTAYNEVDNAVAAYINALKQIDRYEQAAADAERFLILSLDLYTQGLSDFTNVADAQESFLQYANYVISSRGQALEYLIQIYQALGGGYE